MWYTERCSEYYRGVPVEMQLLPKIQVEMVISKVPTMDVINAARQALYTGHIGDGKIFVYDVEDVVKVRTGESGYDALQGAGRLISCYIALLWQYRIYNP